MLRPVASDEELLECIVGGDSGAFAELVDRYHPRLVRLAQATVVKRELAEEVAQETWIAVIRGAQRFEGRSSLRTWLFRICVNRARSTQGREYRLTPVDTSSPTVDRQRFTSSGQWAVPPEDWTIAVDDRLVADALVGQARTAIAELPELQGQVVTLRDVEGLSSQEVCDVLAITAGNERVLLHRGRSRVRARLEEHMRKGG
jgi:RNA polymerase sigma-70 factor, ECF subfamily